MCRVQLCQGLLQRELGVRRTHACAGVCAGMLSVLRRRRCWRLRCVRRWRGCSLPLLLPLLLLLLLLLLGLVLRLRSTLLLLRLRRWGAAGLCRRMRRLRREPVHLLCVVVGAPRDGIVLLQHGLCFELLLLKREREREVELLPNRNRTKRQYSCLCKWLAASGFNP